jgi:hypothetical protein
MAGAILVAGDLMALIFDIFDIDEIIKERIPLELEY